MDHLTPEMRRELRIQGLGEDPEYVLEAVLHLYGGAIFTGSHSRILCPETGQQ